MVHPNNPAIVASILLEGFVVPSSHRLMVDSATPSFSASCSCVRSLRERSPRMLLITNTPLSFVVYGCPRSRARGLSPGRPGRALRGPLSSCQAMPESVAPLPRPMGRSGEAPKYSLTEYLLPMVAVFWVLSTENRTFVLGF